MAVRLLVHGFLVVPPTSSCYTVSSSKQEQGG
uniref:Uncharacterized protein n=1 Tax=Arundo donax TaxID=35708 RepID=A0A0A9G400_ARUDO